MPRVLAIMCEGALYCPAHSEYDAEEVAQGHVIEVTQFDVDCGTGQAEWLEDGCCSVCGLTWGQFRR